MIDKPEGITSFDVIRCLRRQTGIRTFGHAGTLDPFATGLMLIAINKYTRLLSLLDDADKTYQATMILGSATSTGDPEGEIVASQDDVIDKHKLAELKEAVLKICSLKPPILSAIKVDGKRAYDRARANEVFDLPERPSFVHSFAIVEYNYPKLVYVCRVSKGTYIRSLTQWIAEYLGTIAYTKELRRSAIGRTDLSKAVPLSEVNAETINSYLVSALDTMPHLESLTLEDFELKRLSNGNNIVNEGNDNLCILVYDKNSQCRGYAWRRDNTLNPKVNL